MRIYFLSFFLFLGGSVFFASELPRIKILATGGTIAGKSTAKEKSGYTAAQLTAEALLEAVPEVRTIAQVTTEQIAQVASQDISLEIWLKLARRIQEIADNKEADAVVVTHGTDTQEETAYFLHLLIKTEMPVVLVGAMRSSNALSADGPRNLYEAVATAASPFAVGKGVLQVGNNKIFSARDVAKMDTYSVQAFDASNWGAMGVIVGNQVKFFHESLRKHTTQTVFDSKKIDKLPKVEILYLYADASVTALQALIKNKVDGIVLAGVGHGNFHQKFIPLIKKATQEGIVVVRSSRTGAGLVVTDAEVNDDELGTIASEDLNPQKARVLLLLGLTLAQKSREDLQKLFYTY